ncbi:hypothetical protein GCK72_004674 [Caenorhabditis remanei]|uniref:[histone H3]-lysine(27) N-trimethyltransferase n=1 Tax=Caenorhabditis remanei TaxID=31234 RepID=A0A6A5HCZ0_CAERE|nr:hypothetical protein GCK72_004674 [Caenorhabditis remanei]KAF1764724.1 hypothetical protein GCK72_004674 [Caenorhabditis remanei]
MVANSSSEPSTSGPQPPKKRGRKPKPRPATPPPESHDLSDAEPAVEDPSDPSTSEKMTQKKKDRYCKFQLIFTSDKLKNSVLNANTEELKEKIKKLYKEERAQYEALVEEDRRVHYQEWLDDTSVVNIYRKNLIERVGEYKELKVEPCYGPENGHQTCISWIKPDRDENGTVHKREYMDTACIEIGDIRPGMVHWIPIEQSIRTKDQLRLTHMPFFHDGKDDNEVYDSLNHLFPDGIHGFAHNWAYINDYLLYRVMRRALENYDGNIDVFYYTIYCLWPNKFSQRQLSYIFPKYCARYAEPGFDWQRLEHWKSEISKNPTLEQAAANVIEPKCYACLEYICAVHGFVAQISPENVNGDLTPVTLPLPDAETEASSGCGPECWMNLDAQTILDELTPSEEEIAEKRATIYLDRAALAEMSIPDGGMIATMYMCHDSDTFCDFAHKNLDGKLSENSKIRTCRDAYNLIMGFAEYITERRIQMGRPKPRLDHQDRAINFRGTKLRTGDELEAARQSALQTRAETEGKTVEQVITDDAEEEEKKKTQNGKKEKVKLEARNAFMGCNHIGDCGPFTTECSCRSNGTCSHLCNCAMTCDQRFPGCNCAPGQCQSSLCQCYLANWECNPNTCRKCNCEAIDESGEVKKCKNFSMSRFVQKRMYVAPSKISGNGLFLSEDVEKDEFITEYVGERISDEEAERRGAIYDRFKCSYIFNLETGGAIDSYKVGNLSRFANHNEINPTVNAKTMVVNGEHRIGFYARRELKANTELTFDYGYEKEHKDAVKVNSHRKVAKSGKRRSDESQPCCSSSVKPPSSRRRRRKPSSSESRSSEERSSSPMDTSD